MTKDEILSLALSITKKKKAYPDLSDLAEVDVTRDMVRKCYGNLDGLKSEVSKKSEHIFDIAREELSTPKLTKKRFVITTAVTGAKVDTNFLKSIDLYCAKNKAQLLVLVSISDNKNTLIDPALAKYSIIVNDTKINSNISILGIKNSAKRADPVTGLPRVGQRNGTFISASPKQRLKYVATGSNLPHALMSPGAITSPNYIKSTVLIAQNDYVASNDHVMGAVIVELAEGGFYHFRQVQADKQGRFADMGRLYSPSSIANYAPEAMVLGDWHSGETDLQVASALDKLSVDTKTKSWIIHDAFSGNSINHHVKDKHLTKAKMAMENKLSLQDELDVFVQDLVDMSSKRKVVVVKSNHDEFLDRYLDAGYYVTDYQNHKLALQLALHVLDGKNPLKEYFNSKVKATKHEIKWLERDESYQISDIELGQHGDVGSNGARGSAVSMESAYGKCVYGHTHTPNILRDAWCVGTTSKLKLDYNRGASSWLNTSCLVYANGQRQLINVINGKLRI